MLMMMEEDEENIATIMSDLHARTESPAFTERDVIRMALRFHADQIRRRSEDCRSGQLMKQSNSTHHRLGPGMPRCHHERPDATSSVGRLHLSAAGTLPAVYGREIVTPEAAR